MDTRFQRLVIKLGTSTLTAGTSHLSLPRMVDLARQMSLLHASGKDIVLVSSGAIAVGRERLDFPALPKNIPAKQMLAAIGQPRLMAIYEQLFGLYSITIAQVLLTRTDMIYRRSYINSQNTLSALVSNRVIPVINENDTVATEEIRVGDNDTLSAYVANLIEADLLIILTDQKGLFTADPRQDPNAKLITDITTPEIPEEIWQAAGGTSNDLGTGGMVTKLQAADLARRSGSMVVIAKGSDPDVLLKLAAGKSVGTRFHPLTTVIENRKRFILSSGQATGVLVVDDGAVHAMQRGGSLLPVGLQRIEGTFDRGDSVRVVRQSGREVARGLVNYASADLIKICGEKSDNIEKILGFTYGDEVIHRNNMVLL